MKNKTARAFNVKSLLNVDFEDYSIKELYDMACIKLHTTRDNIILFSV